MSVQPLFRLAIATSAALPGIQPDDAHLAVSLRALGVEPVACVWNDTAVDWSLFDAVLVRTPWDYFKHYADFMEWLDRIDRCSIPMINSTALVRWNARKQYLLELADRGVDIIPTQLVPGGDLGRALSAMPAAEVVVKPTVSGGAWHTVRGTVGEARFEHDVARLPLGFDYLVQPFVPEIVGDGEWSLLFFDGRYSHAVIKRAAAGDYRVQADFGGTAERIDPPVHIIEAAERALAGAAAIGHADHAYVRVDGVVAQGRFLLMELEMIEPFLHLACCPEAAERFARNLHRRLETHLRETRIAPSTCVR